MYNLSKKFFLILIIVAFITVPVFAAPDVDEEDEDTFVEMYGLGDQMFFINAGMFIPLFFMDKDFSTTDTNLTLGGVGSLSWQTFISNHVSIGAEFGGTFAMSPNDRILYMVPLTAKATYWFRMYPFEFPVSLGVGGCLSILDDAAHIDMIIKPSVGAYWNYSEEWVFGINAVYWFIPQIYSGNGKVTSDHTMFGNFLETSLSVMFRF